MSDKVVARLQTPKDSEGKRKDIHLITTSEEVIVHPNSDDPKTLEEVINSGGGTGGGIAIEISEEQPVTDVTVLWVKPEPHVVPPGDTEVVPLPWPPLPEHDLEPDPSPTPDPGE